MLSLWYHILFYGNYYQGSDTKWKFCSILNFKMRKSFFNQNSTKKLLKSLKFRAFIKNNVWWTTTSVINNHVCSKYFPFSLFISTSHTNIFKRKNFQIEKSFFIIVFQWKYNFHFYAWEWKISSWPILSYLYYLYNRIWPFRMYVYGFLIPHY